MRDAGLAIQHCTAFAQLAHHLALNNLFFSSTLLALERSNPTDITHRRLYIFNVELILETYRKAVQGSNCCLVFSVIGVQGLCRGNGRVEEYFVEAVELDVLVPPPFLWSG